MAEVIARAFKPDWHDAVVFARKHRSLKKDLALWLPEYLMAVYDFNRDFCLVKLASTETLDHPAYRLVDVKYFAPLSSFFFGVTTILLVRQHLAALPTTSRTQTSAIGLARQKCAVLVLNELAKELMNMPEAPQSEGSKPYLGSVHFWLIDMFWGDLEGGVKVTNRMDDADMAHCPKYAKELTGRGWYDIDARAIPFGKTSRACHSRPLTSSESHRKEFGRFQGDLFKDEFSSGEPGDTRPPLPGWINALDRDPCIDQFAVAEFLLGKKDVAAHLVGVHRSPPYVLTSAELRP